MTGVAGSLYDRLMPRAPDVQPVLKLTDAPVIKNGVPVLEFAYVSFWGRAFSIGVSDVRQNAP